MSEYRTPLGAGMLVLSMWLLTGHLDWRAVGSAACLGLAVVFLAEDPT